MSSMLKPIIYAGVNLDILSLSAVICGFITFISYIYYTRLRKSGVPRSNALLQRLLENYKPEPLCTDSSVHKDIKIKTNIVSDTIGTTIKVDGKELLNFASNNYLNLVGNKDIEKVAFDTIKKYGVGSCGPRGFYGTVDVHLDLEERIAKFMKMEEAVVYSYGFSTIASAIPAYCKRSDVIFCDEKISFAAQKGIEAARSKVYYFKHNDVQDLESKIKEFSRKNAHKEQKIRKFLVLEGIYESTGNICNLPPIVEIRSKYKMRLFMDESQSIGVLGNTGRGISEHFNINPIEIDLVIGSLEGLIGSIGGFCVGTHFIIEHQRLSGLGYCFSASLPPVLTRAAICAFDYLDHNCPNVFIQLQKQCADIHRMLQNIPKMKVTGDERSPVKYLHFDVSDDTDSALIKQYYEDFVTQCRKNGVLVVLHSNSEKTYYRIRVNVNIDFTAENVALALSVMSNAAKKVIG